MKKEEALNEQKRLTEIVRLWVEKNRKVFWEYEVSCFYKSYVIRISNLPLPSEKDISVSSNCKLLGDKQKSQLCKAIEKARPKTELLKSPSLSVQINYSEGEVTAEPA